jgi:hypothetical protein
MESPLNVPPELLRQADALFAVLIANPELLEIGRGYGLYGSDCRLCWRCCSLTGIGEAGKRVAVGCCGTALLSAATR